jgi:hypothetical protein
LPEDAVPNSCFDAPNLVRLDITDNSDLSFGSPLVTNAWFRISRGIEVLYLNGNDFAAVDEKIFLGFFGRLTSLRILLLSHTQLSVITAAMLRPFVRLAVLDLSRNVIRTIPDACFFSLGCLWKLDLSHNALTTIGKEVFDPDTRKRLRRIYLSFNPLTCTCDLLGFRNWYLESRFKFLAEVNRIGIAYGCTKSDDTKISMKDFHMATQACILSREVSKIIITAVTLLLCLLTAVIALFQYRWHIRLFMYEAFRAKGNARRRYLDEGHFAYDVFVSYDSEQQPWVLRHLKPRLERGLGLRLCLHYRDFIPGKNIVDNIVHCVESSKKILMVFSNDFVRS